MSGRRLSGDSLRTTRRSENQTLDHQTLSMNFRLSPQPAEWIDRSRTLRFSFEGKSYTGFAGDTFSSALWANGVRLLGRSFKYHRARGIYSLANLDVNAMMQNGDCTNLRADITPIHDGATITAVNTFGGLTKDRAKMVDRFGACLPVGFYYKTFFRPKRWFPYFEQKMREMAGLGTIDPKLARQRTPKAYDFCDVLVIGAGPAGLSAAIAAAEAGASVVVVDENAKPGGSLNYQWACDGLGASTLHSLLDNANSLPNIQIRPSTVAAGCYADHWVALVDKRRLVKMRSRSVVLATGSCEQPAVFGNNDLPGVMLATAAQRLVHQFAVKPFKRGIIFAANRDGYRAALDLHRAGIAVAAIIDPRAGGESSAIGQQAADAGIKIHAACAVYQAIPGNGKNNLRAAQVATLDGNGQPDLSKTETIDADGIAMSVGWAPADGLHYQAGGRMKWTDALQQFVPDKAPAGLFSAGRMNGVYELNEQMADGRRAGATAAQHVGFSSSPLDPPEENFSRNEQPARSPSHPYPIFPHPKAKCFVDLDEDVQYKDFVHAAQEGFDHVELMKRYSTFGMGPSQGKIANTNAIRILAKIKGRSVGETGVTTSRPFYHPVPLSHLAGRGFHPHRRTPLQCRHQALGAVFIPAGEWERPAYYAQGGKSREALIAEEVMAVRQRVGVIDVGTLGKIEIGGPDAAQFIERLYTTTFATMRLGTTRYGLMCDETGVVIDDGIVCRLADDRFYLTTTTTASGGIYREMQRFAILWKSNVVLANVTGALGAVNLAGPKSRAILQQLTNVDLSTVAFPFLGVREGSVADVPAKLIRVGFVGEWGCEIHAPAYGIRRVWDAIFATGKSDGIRPFGVEAQRVLRLEKGHIIIGQDTDGLTTPLEAGMEWALKSEKPFFQGQRSLQIVGKKPLARMLVGFALTGPSSSDNAGVKECHLIIDENKIVGRVTSVAYSPTLKQSVGLAFIEPKKTNPGAPFEIRTDSGRMVAAKVVPVPFYDPQNQRQVEA
ncbi:MAG: (2Fe-2S)-binding protein [Pirellulales bacterium]|nr:(2Fe-2S)-binding protein [Pirellulales bacterium]